MPRHVIVGASAAGMSAARELRSSGFSGELTVVDRDRHSPYERPRLSKRLAPGTSPSLTPLIGDQQLRELDVELMCGTGVRGLDLVGHRVELDDGQMLAADAVLLATGARPRMLRVPGARLDGVLALRDAEDARKLNDQLAAGGPLVVVGAGFIGLELASAARSAGVSVTVIEKLAAPLATTLGPQLSTWLLDLHRAHGVEVHLGVEVKAFVGHRHVEEVALTDGRRLPAQTVVVGVGVEPEVDLARRAGLRCSAGIVVDGFGRTSDPWVFAAGDVACQPHPHLAAPGRIEHWDSALRHGAAVGATMAGRPTLHSAVPYFWSEQYGGVLQSYGRHRAEDDLVIRGAINSDRAVAVWLRSGAPVATAGFGGAREIRAIKTMIEARTPVAIAAIADPMTDLRQLSSRVLASPPGLSSTHREGESAMPELEGKTVLITGSGSLGGIGADSAQLFAQHGAEVLVAGRHTERGQRVVETILQAGGTARFLLADLANLDDVARLADEAGEVDVLVNNAAGYKLESCLKLTAEDFSLMYDTIVRAAFFLVQKLAPGMVARRSGSIVNVSSTAASVALPGGMSLYGSAKAAMDSLTRYWAAEFAQSNVRVNAIAVGPTSTDNVTAAMTSLGPGVIEGMAASIPLGRWASPREISEFILFLASERSSFATGGVFAADGGKVAV